MNMNTNRMEQNAESTQTDLIKQDALIIADNHYYNMNCYETQLNNNVLVVGTSGSGKTRSIVTPNILQASGSYVVVDPKGNLYNKHKAYLEREGYVVKKLDFIHPEDSVGYNFFHYIKSTKDIVKIAHLLTYTMSSFKKTGGDAFWDQSAELLLTSLISFLLENCNKDDQTLEGLIKLCNLCIVNENDASIENIMDQMMQSLKKRKPNSFAVKQYEKFRVAAGKTLRSILITVNSKLGMFDYPEMQKMLKKDEMELPMIGRQKTAIFVSVSDTDRSMDDMVSIFFTQAMNELCQYADYYCKDNRLPVPVRFIMDDFATNCIITDFPRMISSIRSRGISTMLMIQSEAQLFHTYGDDGRTIIGNCDTYVYLGGNDVDTAKAVAVRCDVPVKRILYMPIGSCWIFRRGSEPAYAKIFPLEEYVNRSEVGRTKPIYIARKSRSESVRIHRQEPIQAPAC